MNSYWLDQAFFHAREAAIWNAQFSGVSPGDREGIIWWCLLIRDRMLALGMRRPHRLHQVHNIRGPLKTEDFGLEALIPSYSTKTAKQRMISSFLWFCKLSEIQARLAEHQKQFQFQRQWERTGPGYSGQFEEVSKLGCFEAKLREWRSGFEESLSTATGNGDDVYAGTVCLIRLIARSVLATSQAFTVPVLMLTVACCYYCINPT